MKTLLALVATLGLLGTACSNTEQATSTPTDPAETTTAQTAAAAEGGVAIALVSPAEPSVPMGDAEMEFMVTDAATGEPVALDDIQIDISMPMEGMETMTTMVKVEPGAEPGQFKAVTNMGMQGMWIVAVESPDPEKPGQAIFNFEVK